LKLRNCSIEEFVKRIDDSMFVCFGAGALFIDMLKFYSEFNIKEKISFIVDNNSNLWNKEIEVENSVYKVYSTDELKKYSKKKVTILITTVWFKEIIKQLDNIYEFNDIEVYVFPIMQFFDRCENIKYKKCVDIQIPKVIHYCWFGGNPLPESARYCIESWKKYCPDYEIIEWNDNNYDVGKIPYTKEAYEAKEYAFVSDYARLDVINQYGGIYMDTDVEVIRNLDELLYNEAYCGFIYHSPRIGTGLGFGAKKGFHILKEWMKSYEEDKFIIDDGTINKKICTYYQTEILRRKNFNENGKLQVVEGMVCFPKEFFDPLSYLTGMNCKSANTYSIHQGRLSWNNMLQNVRNDTRDFINAILKRMEETEKCMNQ